jgi:hypothetical protein
VTVKLGITRPDENNEHATNCAPHLIGEGHCFRRANTGAGQAASATEERS